MAGESPHQAHEQPSAPTAGGRQGSHKRRMEMPTFGTLWRIRLQVPHIGGHQIIPGREVTLSQLLAGFFVFMFVVWVSGLVFGGPLRLMLAIICGGGAGMLVAKVDSGGRSVWRTLQRMFAYTGKCHLYHGAARIGPDGSGKRKRRLLAMLAAEDSRIAPEQGIFAIVREGLSDVGFDLWEVYGPRKKRRAGKRRDRRSAHDRRGG